MESQEDKMSSGFAAETSYSVATLTGVDKPNFGWLRTVSAVRITTRTWQLR